MDPALQSSPFAVALAQMLQLQDLDDEISGFRRRRRELQVRLDDSQARVKKARDSQETLKQSFEQEKKKRGLYEMEIKAKEDDIRRHNQQLNECKTNEAYTAKLNEIKAAKDIRRDLEEKVIQLMENEEALHRQYDEDAKALQSGTVEAEAEQKTIQGEADGLQGQEDALAAKRQAILKELPKDFSELYLRRQGQRPKVITRVGENQVCGSCSMKVPAQQINELGKLKNLIHCQSCGVILVLDQG